MREILFRGKADPHYYPHINQWVYGAYIHRTLFYGDPDDSHWILYTGEFDCDFYDAARIVPKTLGQYTGFDDKHGNKIFEGDIVKTKYGRLCVVVWFSSQVHNGWDLETIKTVENCAYTQYPDAFDLYKKENLEIVGNIHDNPELLGGEVNGKRKTQTQSR